MKFYSLILLEILFHTKKNDTVIVQNCKKKKKDKTCASLLHSVNYAFNKSGFRMRTITSNLSSKNKHSTKFQIELQREIYTVLYIYFNPFHIMYLIVLYIIFIT